MMPGPHQLPCGRNLHAPLTRNKEGANGKGLIKTKLSKSPIYNNFDVCFAVYYKGDLHVYAVGFFGHKPIWFVQVTTFFSYPKKHTNGLARA